MLGAERLFKDVRWGGVVLSIHLTSSLAYIYTVALLNICLFTPPPLAHTPFPPFSPYFPPSFPLFPVHSARTNWAFKIKNVMQQKQGNRGDKKTIKTKEFKRSIKYNSLDCCPFLAQFLGSMLSLVKIFLLNQGNLFSFLLLLYLN